MIPFDRKTASLFVLVVLWVVPASGPAAFGQDDDVIDDKIVPQPRVVLPAPAVQNPQFNAAQIDQWVFSRLGGPDASRARLDANLELRIDDIDRACSMTEIQKKKLKLAGSGDIKRYYDRVEELKRKYTAAKPTRPISTTTSGQEMQPLQIELMNGLFEDDSIFMKDGQENVECRAVEELRRPDASPRGRARAGPRSTCSSSRSTRRSGSPRTSGGV